MMDLRLHAASCGPLVWTVLSWLLLTGGGSWGPPPDPCSPNPCQNGAVCRRRGEGHACFCVPGFQGPRCQVDVNECASQPCRGGGTCLDQVGRFTCLCPTGLTGVTCEARIDGCRSQPCLNGATCRHDRGNYTCECWPGFEGRRCEVDTNECGSGPCMRGGRCVERSWRALYGREPLLPERYDPRRAAGYVCGCPPGTRGESRACRRSSSLNGLHTRGLQPLPKGA